MKLLLTALLPLLFQLTGFAQEYKRIRICEDLELIKLSEHAYVHVSWENSPVYGRFSSNGLIYLQDEEGYLLDTPATDALTKTLVDWVADSLKTKITGFVPNHWHSDCLGGLHYLQTIGVNSYAHQATIDIARSKGLAVPAHGFRDSLTLQLKGNPIQCYYLGAAHSMDNIVVWLPEEKILFAGCMAMKQLPKEWAIPWMAICWSGQRQSIR